jgi:hypothetical protein
MRMKDKYGEGLVGYPKPSTSKGKLLQTVYVGRRQGSDRFLRVYEKLTDDGKLLLRAESEMKRNRSMALYKELCKCKSDDEVSLLLASEVMFQVQKDGQLHKSFAGCLSGATRPVKVRTDEGNTFDWIMNTCIPSIDRYINSHSSKNKDGIVSQLTKMVIGHVDGGLDTEDEKWN